MQSLDIRDEGKGKGKEEEKKRKRENEKKEKKKREEEEEEEEERALCQSPDKRTNSTHQNCTRQEMCLTSPSTPLYNCLYLST